MELSIKGYLLQNGVSHREIINRVSHNLVKGLARAEKFGFTKTANINQDDRDFISIVNELYNNKEYEYPITGTKSFPVFGPLQDMSARLLFASADVIPLGRKMIDSSRAGEILMQCERASVFLDTSE